MRLSEDDLRCITGQLSGESIPTFKEVNENVKKDVKQLEKVKKQESKAKKKKENPVIQRG